MSKRVPIVRTLGVDDQERRDTISEIEDEESFFDDEDEDLFELDEDDDDCPFPYSIED